VTNDSSLFRYDVLAQSPPSASAFAHLRLVLYTPALYALYELHILPEYLSILHLARYPVMAELASSRLNVESYLLLVRLILFPHLLSIGNNGFFRTSPYSACRTSSRGAISKTPSGS